MDVQPSAQRSSLDGELIAAHLQGQSDALEKLYRRHYPRLIAYLIPHVKSREVAEDMVQDVFVRALADMSTFEVSRRTVWPWLRTVADHLVTDYRRRNATLPMTVNHDAAVDNAAAIEAPDDTEMIADRQVLGQALNALSDHQRVAMRLKYLHDWPARDIARMLNLTRETTEQLLHRGRSRLTHEYHRLQRERTFGWVLLYPFWRLRDRLARARDAAAASGPPAPFMTAAEAWTATAAATVMAAAIGVGSLLSPSPSPSEGANEAVRGRDRASEQTLLSTAGVATRGQATLAASTGNHPTGRTSTVTLRPDTPADEGPEVTVEREIRREEDDEGHEHTTVVIEVRRPDPITGNDEHETYYRGEFSCEGPVSGKICDVFDLVPEDP